VGREFFHLIIRLFAIRVPPKCPTFPATIGGDFCPALPYDELSCRSPLSTIITVAHRIGGERTLAGSMRAQTRDEIETCQGWVNHSGRLTLLERFPQQVKSRVRMATPTDCRCSGWGGFSAVLWCLVLHAGLAAHRIHRSTTCKGARWLRLGHATTATGLNVHPCCSC